MNNVLILTQILMQFAQNVDGIARLLNLAHSEGRDVTDAELDVFASGDDAARKALQDLIDAKRSA